MPPVPTVEAEVPPTAAEPADPPEMLVCALSGVAAASKVASAAEVMSNFIACSFPGEYVYGEDVEIVQPFTVMVLAETDPGPPDVDDELDTLPPPACTFTEAPPAELLLETPPATPLVDDDPIAVILPSACFSTETEQVSPVAVLPFFSMVSAKLAPLTTVVSASAAVKVLAWVIRHSCFQRKSGTAVAVPGKHHLSFFHSSLL